jgi:hypothetical protein
MPMDDYQITFQMSSFNFTGRDHFLVFLAFALQLLDAQIQVHITINGFQEDAIRNRKYLVQD